MLDGLQHGTDFSDYKDRWYGMGEKQIGHR